MKMYKYKKEHGEDMTYESEIKHKFDDRGDHDLTKQIEMLKARIADLESIDEVHRKLNQELRKETWQYKEKAGQVEALQSRVDQQQQLIKDLSNTITKLRK